MELKNYWFAQRLMNFKQYRYLLLLLGCISWNGFGQNVHWTNRLYAESNYHYGFLMPHTDFISFFVQKHIQGMQFNVGILTNGEKSWHHSYNYPLLGIGYHRSSLANNNVYGHFDALFAYVDRYYLNWNKRFNFGNRLSFGAAYINKKFDLESNGTNLAIGSNVNVYINYSLETILRITPRLNYKLGAGITHVSNGNMQQPNKGLNIFTVFTGLNYSFNKPNYLVNSLAPESSETSKHQYNLWFSFGRKQISRKYDETYSVASVSGEYLHVIKGNSWGGAAVSLYFDPSLPREIELTDTVATNFSDKLRVTLNLMYELKMGKISYVFQPGVYLKNPYKKSGSISNRLSIRYQINPTLSAGITIKAHWFAIADLFEWGIGYKWNK